jgi:biopolymer transport protein TolQ
VIAAVSLACERAAAQVHLRVRRELSTLATIASIAGFLGVFGTMIGIVSSFKGIHGERSAIMAGITRSLSESLVPAALGLLVAVPAFCAFQYLRAEAESFRRQLDDAALELVNCLATWRLR